MVIEEESQEEVYDYQPLVPTPIIKDHIYEKTKRLLEDEKAYATIDLIS